MDKWVEYAAKDFKIIWGSFHPNSPMKELKCGPDTGESETTNPTKIGGWLWKGQEKPDEGIVKLYIQQCCLVLNRIVQGMWRYGERWCYSFGSKLKIRDTGMSVTTMLFFLFFLNWGTVVAMLFLPLFKRHCLPNIQYVLRSWAEYNRKPVTLTLRQCKGSMMPWKFQRSQMGHARERTGNP